MVVPGIFFKEFIKKLKYNNTTKKKKKKKYRKQKISLSSTSSFVHQSSFKPPDFYVQPPLTMIHEIGLTRISFIQNNNNNNNNNNNLPGNLKILCL